MFSVQYLLIVEAEEWTAPSKLTNLSECYNPVISGDGTKIAFDRLSIDLKRQQIYVINADGTGLNGPLANGEFPSINEDGSKIVFASEGEIYIINSDGSDRAR
jgi:Tol biopolymer transport system component